MLGITQTIFLNLGSHTKVWSQLMVLYIGCASFNFSGVYFTLHSGSLWFLICIRVYILQFDWLVVWL